MRLFCLIWLVLALPLSVASAPIDRHALVTRHNVVLTKFDPENPLQVGNGEFAFSADIAGLQTFADAYEKTIPLGTLSQWGWHTFPNRVGWSIDKFQFKEFTDFHGRKVGYADVPSKQGSPESNWLRMNPHRLDLGQIGFLLTKTDGTVAKPGDLTEIRQTLDLWNGILVSWTRSKLEDESVEVQTVCHPIARSTCGARRIATLEEGSPADSDPFPVRNRREQNG